MFGRLLAPLVLILLMPASAAAQEIVDDNPAVASPAAGRLEVAARAADGTIVVRSLDTASGAWSPWTAVRGVTATSGPALAADDDGTLHVFTRAADSTVAESVRTGEIWSGWSTPTAGKLRSGPGAANRVGTTELDLGGLGLDGAFFHAFRRQPGVAFSAFGRVGPAGTTAPGLVSSGTSRLAAFVRAADGSVATASYVPGGTFSPGDNLGGTVLSAITAITRADTQMDIYARGVNDRIYGQTFDGTAWRGFVPLPISVAGTSAPAATTTGGGRVDLVVRDATTLYHAVFTPAGGWSGFTPVPDPIVAPADRGAVNGTGGGDGARVALGFTGSRKTARTTSLGRRVRLQGQLVNAAGAPVAGAQIVLSARNLVRGAAQRIIAVVPTGADGTFAHAYRAGPGQRIDAQYVAYANDGAVAAAAGVTQRTRASATLRVSRRSARRGTRLRFSGRLRGGAVPARGTLVLLQAYERGRWRTFEKARSGRRGAFRAAYRFGSSPSRPTRFRFRALVPGDAGYPFARGTSRRRVVTLRP